MKRFLLLAPPVFVLTWAFVYALAYLRVVNSPHPYEAASRWIYANIAPGSRLLSVHWDDKLPLSLPGFSPQDYHYQWFSEQWELPVYERDSEEKLNQMAERLSQADYLIFPTPRIPGSIPRLPEEFPHTTAFLRLLYADRLGYELVRTFKTRPAFGPISFNDDLADESISVYDHPKVAVFKNVRRLSPEEIKARILYPSAPLPSREQILLRDLTSTHEENGTLTPSDDKNPALVQLVIWLVVLQLLAWIISPFFAYALPAFPDNGYGLARALSFLLVAYVAWFLQASGIIEGTPQAGWFVVVLLGLASFVFVRSERLRFVPFFQNWRREGCFVEAVFLFCFLLILLWRAFQPEIFWGEKPMNFTFLNYFIRLRDLPPDDPWAAGQPMHYYYLGSFIYAFLHKLTGVDAHLGYNLSIATIGATLFCALYSLLYYFSRRRWMAACGAAGVVFLSNLEWIRLLCCSTMKSFDFFWATTRLFTSPAFAEYPIWSYLFGDLHAHVMALPLVAGAIGLVVALASSFFSDNGEENVPALSLRSGSTLVAAGLLALVWGALIAVNSWDFVSLAVIMGVLAALAALKLFCHPGCGRRPRLGGVILLAVFTALLALLSAWPYLSSSSPAISQARLGWVYADEFNSLGQIFRHFGVFLVLLGLVWVGFVSWGKEMSAGRLAPSLIISLFWSALPAALGLASRFKGVTSQPWLIIGLACSLVFIGAFVFLMADQKKTWALTGALVVAAGFGIAFTELMFFMDRMNTIFKFFNIIWLLLGISAAAWVTGPGSLFTQAAGSSIWRRILKALAIGLGGLVCLLGLIGAAIDIRIMTTFRRVSGPRPTLDGGAYLARYSPAEAALFAWINRHISGTPVVLEAHGPSYGSFTRVAMHTGLPVVLGWDYHVFQRGTPRSEIEARKKDIFMIYAAAEPKTALALLLKYRVQYVVVGSLEEALYPREGLKKFADNPALFTLLFKSGNARLYQVRYGEQL